MRCPTPSPSWQHRRCPSDRRRRDRARLGSVSWQPSKTCALHRHGGQTPAAGGSAPPNWSWRGKFMGTCRELRELPALDALLGRCRGAVRFSATIETARWRTSLRLGFYPSAPVETPLGEGSSSRGLQRAVSNAVPRPMPRMAQAPSMHGAKRKGGRQAPSFPWLVMPSVSSCGIRRTGPRRSQHYPG